MTRRTSIADRGESLTIRLSAEEKRAIEAAAREAGLSLTGFIRMRCLGGVARPEGDAIGDAIKVHMVRVCRAIEREFSGRR